MSKHSFFELFRWNTKTFTFAIVTIEVLITFWRAPWAASCQGIQDGPEAKTANWLYGYVAMYVAHVCGPCMWLSCRLRFHLFSQRCTSSRQVGFLCAAHLCKIRRIFCHVEMIVQCVSNEWILSNLFFDVLKSVTYESLWNYYECKHRQTTLQSFESLLLSQC